MQSEDASQLEQGRSCTVVLGFVLAVTGAGLAWGWEAAVLVAGLLLFRGTS